MAEEVLLASIRGEILGFQRSLQDAVQQVQQMHRATASAGASARATELEAVRQQNRLVLDAQRQAGRLEVEATRAAHRERLQAAQAAHQQQVQAERQAHQQRLQALREANNAAKQEVSGFQAFLKQALTVGAGLGIVTTITGLVAGIKTLVTESVAAATRMQSLTAAFTLISGGAAKAQATFAFLRAETTRIGVDFVTTAEAFKRFEAAARGTALEGTQARNVFIAVSEAMRVVGGTSEQTQRALTALEQMISKGKVSCYDGETEVLTSEGWVRWDQVQPHHCFATRDLATGRVVYVPAIHRLVEHYTGPMLRIKHPTLDLLVTPNHRMVVRTEGETQYQVIAARDLEDRDYWYLVSCDEGEEILINPSAMRWEPYNGLVYCATVLYTTLFVRRHGAAVWSGNSEELRLQLGEHLPGAFQIAARAMGVTTAELGKMLEAGNLLATDFLPKFAAQLRKEFGPGVENAAKTAAATFARLGNEIQVLGVQMGNAVLKLLQPAAAKLEELLRKTREANDRANAVGAQAAASTLAGKPVFGGPETAGALLPAGATEQEIAEFQRLSNELGRRQALLREQAGQLPNLATGGMRGRAGQEANIVRLEAELKVMKEQVQERLRLAQQDRADLDSLGERAMKNEQLKTANDAYKKSVEAVLVLQKDLPKELQNAAIKADILSGTFTTAEVKLTKMKTLVGDFQEILEKKPSLRLDPRVQEVEKLYKTTVQGLEKQVALEKEQEATQKRTATEARTAAKAAQREAEQLLEKRQALIDSMVQEKDFKLRDPSLAAINADMAFFNNLLTTETGPRLDAVRTIMVELDEAKQRALGTFPTAMVEGLKDLGEAWGNLEQDIKAGEKAANDYIKAQEKLDVLAGKGVSTFDKQRVELRQQIDDIEKFTGETTKTREVLQMNLERIQEAETKHAAEELKKQSREYEQFAKRVQDTTADTIFDALSGRIQSFKDLLTSMKDFFLKILSQMVAAAITRPIIIPIVTAFTGALGLNELLGITAGVTGGTGGGGVTGGGGGGGGGSGVGGGLLTFGQQANTISGALGGPTVQSTLGLNSPGGLLSQIGSTTLLAGTAGSAGAATGLAGLASGTGALTLGSGATLGTIGGTAGSFAAAGGAGSTALGGAAGGGLLGSGTATAGAAGLSLGTAAAGVGTGVATGFALKAFNDWSGLTGAIGSRGSSAFAGAGGGAAAGAIIGTAIPVIGTAIGAAIGAIVGAIGGAIFGGGKPQPRFETSQASAAQLGFVPGQGITIPSFVPFSARGSNLAKGGTLAIQNVLNDASGQLFGQLQETVRQFPEILQEKALPALQELSGTFAQTFNNLKFKGKDIQKQVEKFVNETMPKAFTDIFDPFLKVLQRVAPVIQQFEQAIAALEQRQAEAIRALEAQQAQILETIRGARQTITEAIFTPAQFFETRRDELDTLVGQFRTGTGAQRAQLAPQIAGLTQEVTRLSTAQEVLGDDREAIRDVQRQMLDILTEVETGTRSAFEEEITNTRKLFEDAITATKEQRDILLNSLSVQGNIEGLLSQAVSYLGTLTGLLQPVGSFQTLPGESRQVHLTGLAMVHRGEFVSRPSNNTSGDTNYFYDVTVQAPPGSTPEQVADLTLDAIRKIEARRGQVTRYRQHRTL